MQALTALADPTRRRIVEMLAERDLPVGEIASQFKMSAPAISQHLKVLQEAGLIKARIDGQRRIQMLDRAGLDEIEDWLAHTRRFWERRLDDLEREIINENKNNRSKEK